MIRAYDFLLRLYPREHRLAFGGEMRSVFADAAADRRAQGCRAYSAFLLNELGGLLLGLGRQWLRHTSASSLPPAPQNTASLSESSEITECRLRISRNLRLMEHAIAHHQFTQARFYSEADRREREHLEDLCRRRDVPPETGL